MHQLKDAKSTYKVNLFLLVLVCMAPSLVLAQTEPTHITDTGDIGSFCLITSLVLFPSYVLSWLCGKVKLPEYLGAILIGLFLGETGLGNFAPNLHQYLFPNDTGFDSLIKLVSFLGASTLMFDAGLAVNLDSVKKSAKECTMIGVLGLAITTISGFLLLFFIHQTLNIMPSQSILAPLAIASLFAICPLVIIFKLLDECRLLGSETAAIKLGGSALGEILALLFISIFVGLYSKSNSSSVILMFPALALAIGAIFVAPWFEKIVRSLSSQDEQNTISIRSIAMLLILYGAFFAFFKLPVIFGFFIAGVLVNRTTLVNPEVRKLFTQVSHQIWVPFFFAASVFEVDFLSNMNWMLLFLYTSVAIFSKGIITYLVSLRAGLTKFDARLTAVSFIPIAVAGIALMPEFERINLITEEMYTAFYGAVVVTTVLAGIFFKFFVGKENKIPLLELLDRDIIELSDIHTESADYQPKLKILFKEIAVKKAEILSMTPEEMLESIYKDHNYLCSDNAEHGFLAIHLRTPKTDAPKLILARSKQGLKLPAADGEITHFITLLAIPEGKSRTKLEVALWPLMIDFLETHHARELLNLDRALLLDKLLSA